MVYSVFGIIFSCHLHVILPITDNRGFSKCLSGYQPGKNKDLNAELILISESMNSEKKNHLQQIFVEVILFSEITNQK